MLKSLEWSRVHSRADLSGIETLHAHFVRHRYARHAHEFAVIGLVESGIQSYYYLGARHRTGPGGVFVVNPQEPHTGEPGDTDGYIYRALYPTSDFLCALFGDEQFRHLRFRDPVVYDRAVSCSGRWWICWPHGEAARQRYSPIFLCQDVRSDSPSVFLLLNTPHLRRQP
jgi:hypothetical protein